MAYIESSNYKPIGKKGVISYSGKDLLGRGGYGSVHRGSFKGREVAVKRIKLIDCVGKEREIELQFDLHHKNVLQILEVNEDDIFRYIVLELCAGTLERSIKKEYTGPMPSDVNVLYQIACGVQYLHSNKLIHCDIKPANILISCTVPVLMKVSNFALSKITSINGTFPWSGIKGPNNWIAPEISSLNSESWRGFVQNDIFATGCVYFWFITS